MLSYEIGERQKTQTQGQAACPFKRDVMVAGHQCRKDRKRIAKVTCRCALPYIALMVNKMSDELVTRGEVVIRHTQRVRRNTYRAFNTFLKCWVKGRESKRQPG